MSEYNYTVSEGLVRLVATLGNGGAQGTGIQKLVYFCKNVLGGTIPPAVITYGISVQNNIFGDYPNHSDIAPSIVFSVAFFVLGLMHFFIFMINFSRGHYFYLSMVWVVYCMMRIVGFALRAYWGADISQVSTGLTSELFLIIPSIVIVSVNLILAQRLFTWRHPVGGSRRLFQYTMIGIYTLVIVVIAVTVTGSFVPYIDYLSQAAYIKWQNVVMATSILVILYSLTSIILIGLSYWAPTKKDERLYTYQPWWIESFSPFYFVKPGAAQEAEETFMKRNHNHRHAIRVIAATHHHHNMVQGLSNQRGDLKHNWSIIIIAVSTLFILIGAIGRSIAVFQGREQRYQGPICNHIAMYICWGLFEVFINVLYIVGRVDLRFYRPDVLPQKVRAIITAEQTYYPSEEEDEGDEEEARHEVTDDEEEEYEYETEDKSSGLGDNDWKFDNGGASSIDHLDFQNEHNHPPGKPPYPVYTKDDNESEFNF